MKKENKDQVVSLEEAKKTMSFKIIPLAKLPEGSAVLGIHHFPNKGLAEFHLCKEVIVPVFEKPIIEEVVALEKKHIYISTELESLGSDEWEFGFVIWYLPKEAYNLKRRAGSLVKYESFSFSGGATYMGAWPTIVEALTEGVKYAKEKVLPLVE